MKFSRQQILGALIIVLVIAMVTLIRFYVVEKF